MSAEIQPSLFPDLVPVVAPQARQAKVSREYDPMTDMWGQRPNCPECGKRMFRQGACIICHCGHEEWMEMNKGRPHLHGGKKA